MTIVPTLAGATTLDLDPGEAFHLEGEFVVRRDFSNSGCTGCVTQLYLAGLPGLSLLRKGLREILAADRGLLIVGEAADGEQALDLIRTTSPHVAVLDVDMPRKNGIAVAGEVRALGLAVGIIFLTMHKNERFFNAALDIGVRGYMLKETASMDIVDGIKAVAGGRSYVTPALSDYLINRHRTRRRRRDAAGVALADRTAGPQARGRIQDVTGDRRRAVHQHPHRRPSPRQHCQQTRADRPARPAAIRLRAQD